MELIGTSDCLDCRINLAYRHLAVNRVLATEGILIVIAEFKLFCQFGRSFRAHGHFDLWSFLLFLSKWNVCSTILNLFRGGCRRFHSLRGSGRWNYCLLLWLALSLPCLGGQRLWPGCIALLILGRGTSRRCGLRPISIWSLSGVPLRAFLLTSGRTTFHFNAVLSNLSQMIEEINL